MKGEDLKRLVDENGIKAKNMAAALGVVRQHLYNLYKMEDIGKEYSDKVKSMGLSLRDTKRQKDDTMQLTASQLYKMWEEAETQRQAITNALVSLVETHKKLIDAKLLVPSSAKGSTV